MDGVRLVSVRWGAGGRMPDLARTLRLVPPDHLAAVSILGSTSCYTYGRAGISLCT